MRTFLFVTIALFLFTAANAQSRKAKRYVKNGQESYAAGKTPESIKAYSSAIEDSPNYPDAYRLRGMAYLREKKYVDAVQDFNKATMLNPNDATSFYYRAQAEQAMQQDSLAYRDYSQAVQLDPSLEGAWYNRGMLAMKDRKYKDAAGDFSAVSRLRPGNDSALSQLALASYYTMDYDAALSNANLAIAHNPGFSDPYYVRGETRLAMGKTDSAMADFDRALAMGNWNAYAGRAHAYYVDGN